MALRRKQGGLRLFSFRVSHKACHIDGGRSLSIKGQIRDLPFAVYNQRFCIIQFLLVSFVFLVFLPFSIFAHVPADIDSTKTVRSVRVGSDPPRLDGRLDDEVWARAPSFSRFTQGVPDDGDPATEKTLVQFAFDEDALYVAMTLFYSDPDLVADHLTRRDQTQGVDRFRVEIDTHHDHQTAYMFELSAAGVQRDGHITKNGGGFDGNWDAVWEGRVAPHPDGLSAEWRIPYQTLRFQPANQYTWGINIVRSMHNKHEMVYWVRIPRNQRGWVSRFGHLQGLRGISPAGALEVLPYSVGRIIRYPGGDLGTDLSSRVGADLRYGFSHSTSLNATINPDFGQVEADPAQLNLTVFETFQSERRPFFVEGAEMFRTPISLFYSRRIGRRPGFLPAPAGWNERDRPESTTVLGALKLTGKTRGKTTFGLMEAVTASEYARIDSAGLLHRALVEPRTNYLVGRVIQDVLRNSHIGVLGTALSRNGGNDAWSAGLDWQLHTNNNDYEFSGQVASSRTDARSGWASDFELGKRTGRWQAEISMEAYSPGFDINNMGFLRRRDIYEPHLEIEFDNRDPWKIFRITDIWLERWRKWNFDDVTLEDAIEVGTWNQLTNYWSFGGGYTHNYRSSDDLDTRGGPLISIPASNQYWVSLSNDWRQPTSGSVNFSWGSNHAGSTNRRLKGNLTLKPASSLEVSVSPSYSWNHDDAQWVGNVDDNNDGAADHYVYGELESKTFDLTTRVNIIFNPRLSLEAYAQSFVTAGDFEGFKELAEPGTYLFTPFATPSNNPDFRRRSLRSNVVLRWEYRLGSAFFLVWSQNRSDRSEIPDLRAFHNLGSSFGDAGTNVLFVKATYWLNL